MFRDDIMVFFDIPKYVGNEPFTVKLLTYVSFR